MDSDKELEQNLHNEVMGGLLALGVCLVIIAGLVIISLAQS